MEFELDNLPRQVKINKGGTDGRHDGVIYRGGR